MLLMLLLSYLMLVVGISLQRKGLMVFIIILLCSASFQPLSHLNFGLFKQILSEASLSEVRQVEVGGQLEGDYYSRE